MSLVLDSISLGQGTNSDCMPKQETRKVVFLKEERAKARVRSVMKDCQEGGRHRSWCAARLTKVERSHDEFSKT